MTTPDAVAVSEEPGAFQVVLFSTADEDRFDEWLTIEGAGTPTGIGVHDDRVVVTFTADDVAGGETAYLVGRWTKREAVYQEWLNVERAAVPVDVAACDGELYLLFAARPGASGDFMLKQWDTYFGGWDEWKDADGGVPVAVDIEENLAYILLRRAGDK
ncbi:MAG: hypothetical protein GF403_04080 [Candidatus Coatesbacteria bacterium]|nr:hypothetical protein [Candidatus Coatesbacteria bacterium]